ncbi:hypothetical protein [Rhodococcus pyridinivorans]|uniref:hypothetical protein n=1 Tax=Rhodococcus pyridinivorans TaxID=103816 RepID=UPI0022836A87|nr:hypothetical protein [Rhodococcus pyridinivorans]WAL46791.1 hypothetical protein OQN32_01375 [Rhodococcus pyridinivorans]
MPQQDTAFDHHPPEPTPEVALLAAALTAPADDVQAVTPLVLDDLTEIGTRDVLDTVCALAAAGQPHDTIAVGDELQRRGLLAGHTGQQIKMCLLNASTAGRAANPLALRRYAAAVSANAFRQRFETIGKALTEAAAAAPEHDLMPMLRQAGTDAVRHAKRLATLRGEQEAE